MEVLEGNLRGNPHPGWYTRGEHRPVWQGSSIGMVRCSIVVIRLRSRGEAGTVRVMAGSFRKRVRLNLDFLDPEDPFEIDGGNRVHLIKHLPSDDSGRSVAVGPEDVLDVYLYGDPDYYPGGEGGQADWLMVGMVPGLLLCIPLAPPNSGDARFCRPIGIYTPSGRDRNRYLGG